MLKSAIPFICKRIMQAFNIILNSGKFLKSWKDGIIIPVYTQLTKNVVVMLCKRFVYVVGTFYFNV